MPMFSDYEQTTLTNDENRRQAAMIIQTFENQSILDDENVQYIDGLRVTWQRG